MFSVGDKVYFYNNDKGEYYPARILGKDMIGTFTIKYLAGGKWIEANNIDEAELSARAHTETLEELVNSPAHYNAGKIEVIDAIEDWDLNFNLGNAIKYIARCKHKGNKRQDLSKAVWYINRELSKED